MKLREGIEIRWLPHMFKHRRFGRRITAIFAHVADGRRRVFMTCSLQG